MGYTGNDTELVLPDNYNGESYEIYDYAFYSCDGLKSVVIGDSVTSIGHYAFYNCSSLASVVIPDSVTSIGSSAFFSCDSLTSVVIPDSVTKISRDTFSSCNNLIQIENGIYYVDKWVIDYDENALRDSSVVLRDDTVGIAALAFNTCKSITSITIPNSIKNIGRDAFTGSSNLSSVCITDLAAWCSISFENVSANPLYSAEKLYLVIDGESTLITDLVIPDNISSIGAYAFYSCDSLTSIIVPDCITQIGERAFVNCFNLTDITVDKNNALYKSINGDLYTKDGKTLIQYSIGKIDTSFVITTNVTSIEACAFLNANYLTSINIPDNITYIGDDIFRNCSGLAEVTIGNGLKSISDSTFYNCDSLITITIPDSITVIDNWAFRSCECLTSVTIGNNVTSIGEGVFNNCSSLKSINYTGTVEEWNAISKGNYWNLSTGAYSIYCTDGEITKNGTVTYY